MSVYRRQLAPALRAMSAACDTSYAWFGRRSRPLPRAVRAALGPEHKRAFLAAHIADELYGSFYVRGRAVAVDPADQRAHAPSADFVRALSDANRGTGGWERGWRIASVDGDRATVTRGELTARARAGDWRPAEASAPGTPVELRRPSGYRALSPGFYLARGDVDREASTTELRVYFHPTPAGAVTLMSAVTGLLNDAAIGFALKVVANPELCRRCDAAVLYLRPADFEAVRPTLRAIVAACAPQLQAPVPAFTKRLAPGVAVGEHERAGGMSFGTSRCRLVADAIALAGPRAVGGPPAMLDRVAARFAAAGLDLDRPYLVERSGTHYEL